MTEATWLTLGEASRLLGVDPDTLRRWSDAGKVATFRTPGRHRRFRREDIGAMLPRPRAARPPTPLGGETDRVSAEFRRRVRADLLDQDWRSRFDEASLRWFRERGVRMSDLLLGALDTRGARRAELRKQVVALGHEYGIEAARHELSLGEATQAFLFFRARFMAEIANVARRRALDAPRAAALFEDADHALDAVIVALIDGHQRR